MSVKMTKTGALDCYEGYSCDADNIYDGVTKTFPPPTLIDVYDFKEKVAFHGLGR